MAMVSSNHRGLRPSVCSQPSIEQWCKGGHALHQARQTAACEAAADTPNAVSRMQWTSGCATYLGCSAVPVSWKANCSAVVKNAPACSILRSAMVRSYGLEQEWRSRLSTATSIRCMVKCRYYPGATNAHRPSPELL